MSLYDHCGACRAGLCVHHYHCAHKRVTFEQYNRSIGEPRTTLGRRRAMRAMPSVHVRLRTRDLVSDPSESPRRMHAAQERCSNKHATRLYVKGARTAQSVGHGKRSFAPGQKSVWTSRKENNALSSHVHIPVVLFLFLSVPPCTFSLSCLLVSFR